MRYYWTFAQEAINGAIKRVAGRTTNHRQVGWAVLQRHLMERVMMNCLNTPLNQGTKALNRGKAIPLLGDFARDLHNRLGVTLREHARSNITFLHNWMSLRPNQMVRLQNGFAWIDTIVYNPVRGINHDIESCILLVGKDLRLRGTINRTGQQVFKRVSLSRIIPLNAVKNTCSHSFASEGREFLVKTVEQL